MRSVVYPYDDLQQLADAIDGAKGQELAVPAAIKVRDGEWVLAIFELSQTRRATAAAGRGILLDEGFALVFERRDWERLRQFANAPRGESASKLVRAPAAAPSPASPAHRAPAHLVAHSGSGEQQVAEDVGRSGIHPAGVPALLRSTMAWESAGRASPPDGAHSDANARTESNPPHAGMPLAPSEGGALPSAASGDRATGERAAAAEEEDPTLRQQRISGSGALVLLVDDDPDLREVVGAMLEAVGLHVELVESAEQALDAMAQRVPDLVVLDWGLPGMSGIDLCRAIREKEQLASLAVLFLTAHSGTQDMVEAFAAGADDYVMKPFRAAELGARIFGLLRRSRAGAPRGAH